MNPLWAAIDKEWWWQLATFVGLFFAGIVLGRWGWNKSAIVTGLGAVAVVSSFTLLVKHLRQRPAIHPLRILLHQHPHAIVWVYTVRTQRMPFGIELLSGGTVYFFLADGEELSIGLPDDKLKIVAHTLSRLLPHATFGYSPEKARRYQKRYSSNS